MIKTYVELSRPFTLLAPAVGVAAGGVCARGAVQPGLTWQGGDQTAWLFDLILGAVAAGVLNAASNAINQIYDLEIDRINKPNRVLVEKRLGVAQAARFTVFTAIAAFGLAAAVNPVFLGIVVAAAVCSWAYSAPPARFKRFTWGANLIVAIPRGVLLPVAGWSTTASIAALEPWLLGGVMGVFIAGAASTKDFADVAGDEAGGCKTLPIVYGAKKAAQIIAPFLVTPFLALAAFALLGRLHANAYVAAGVGVALAVVGAYTAYLLISSPWTKTTENHPAWRLMYLTMVGSQLGLMVAYWT